MSNPSTLHRDLMPPISVMLAKKVQFLIAKINQTFVGKALSAVSITLSD